MLNDKVVVITGASRGLGKAIARKLDQLQAKVCLVARNENELNQVASELQRATVYPCDITSSEATETTVNKILAEHGHIDILINNAGMGYYKPFLEHSSDQHNQIIDLNFRALVDWCYRVVPNMRERKTGHIITIGSDVGLNPIANMAVYSATKFAARGFTLSLLREVKGDGVKVSLVNPGIIDTHFNNGEEGSKDANWSLQPSELADLIAQVLTQPGYQLVDELCVHPLDQDF
jgi:short-subunit dehydrogenase